MKFGQSARSAGRTIKAIGLSLALLAAPQVANAQAAAAEATATEAAAVATDAAAATAAPAVAAPAPAPAAPAVDPNDPRFKVAPGGYTPMQPTPGKGMPVDGGLGTQTQFSDVGDQANALHDALLYIIVAITIFVFLLLALLAAAVPLVWGWPLPFEAWLVLGAAGSFGLFWAGLSAVDWRRYRKLRRRWIDQPDLPPSPWRVSTLTPRRPTPPPLVRSAYRPAARPAAPLRTSWAWRTSRR